MRVDRCGRLLAAFGLASLLAALPGLEAAANPSQQRPVRSQAQPASAASSGLQCVPFARQLSGIDITGNAHTWWAQAEGRYQRGHKPEPGAVLVFRATGGMRLGHVSVVSRVVSPRHILVDHANWQGPGLPKGRVARGVSVIDVSEDNTWTLVRVEIHGDRDGFGRHYPTFGFVLPRTVDGERPGPLVPISTARAQADERAARAAQRPATFHGRGAALGPVIAAEIAEAGSAAPQRIGPAINTLNIARALTTQTSFADTSTLADPPGLIRPAALPAPLPAPAAAARQETVRVAQFAPRTTLFADDDGMFPAPDRSLR
jgi:surface antigen